MMRCGGFKVIDRTTCPDAERIPVQAVLDNAEDYSPEEMAAEIYESLPVDRARRIIEFARSHAAHPG